MPATVTGAMHPASTRVSAAGELPVPVGYAAAAVTGGVGYLVGGQASSAPWLMAAAGPGRLAPGSDPSVLPADVLIADHHNNRLLIVDRYGRIRWEFPRP